MVMSPRLLDRAEPHTITVVATMVALLATMIGMFLLICAFPLLVRHMFRAADGHPLLRPLIAGGIAGWAIVEAVVSVTTHGLEGNFPLAVAIVLTFGGAATVLALAAIEWIGLHRLGIRVRLAQ